LGGIDAPTSEEHLELSQQITEQLRKVRWKIDQEITRRNKQPLFKNLYTDKYEKEEFLLDADMEFFKVKKLLDNNPNVLKDDPLLSIDYMKIISLIKRKKLLEDTSDHYDPENSYTAVWNDLSELKRDELMRERERMADFAKDDLRQEAGVRIADVGEEARDSTVKNSKKKELREQRQIVKQFDKLATKFERGSGPGEGAGDTMKVVNKQTGKLVAETAGMLK